MNTICEKTKVCGMWVIKIQVPSGAFHLINHQGTLEDAVEKARWAEAEPA